jgi:hypothetical protein
MMPDQCRAARQRLNWTRHELSHTADVPLWFITAFEDCGETPGFLAGYEVDLRKAPEEVGIGFPFEIANGLIGPAGITYSPRDRRTTN